jgi:hypothetical protein
MRRVIQYPPHILTSIFHLKSENDFNRFNIKKEIKIYNQYNFIDPILNIYNSTKVDVYM